ncbi:MAG: efflux RND transporter periplasmic adaptor subunit [Pirellulaceae bacterium]
MAKGIPRSGASGLLVFAVLTVAAALTGGAYYVMAQTSGDDGEAPLIHIVKKESFDHIVLEQGEVESSSNVELVCSVKSRNSGGTAILWVADEGTPVKKGDKLVELDQSALEEEFKQQRIIVNSSLALKISAESSFEQAIVAKEEYETGIFVEKKLEIENYMLEAKEQFEQSKADLAHSEKLQARGFEADVQVAAKKFAVLKYNNSFMLWEVKLKTLEEITKRKMLIGFEADIETARARKEAEISSHEEEVLKLAEVQEQIKNCTLYAPEDGIVVHANRYSSRGGSAEFVVEAGAVVRERQTIVKLPDPTQMQIKAKINEARVPLVIEGMPVAITIGAFQTKTLMGKVIKVNKYAEPSSYFSSSVKEYGTFIEIIDPPIEVRTGMTAEVRIFVEQIEKALQVPVQALHEFKGHMFVLVQTIGKKGEQVYETREIEIGASNDKHVTIEVGLEVDDRVVLNPRAHLDKFQMPDLPDILRVDEDIAGSLREMSAAVQRPSDEGRGGPGAGGEGRGGRGGEGRGGGEGRDGGEGRGGEGRGQERGSGGGSFNPNTIAQSTLDQFDTDKDGSLSSEEIDAMPENRKSSALRADANKDGSVTRSELVQAMQAMMRGRQQGGGGGGNRRPGGER